MTIDSLVAMAERIHDAEGWRLGAGSTRETRNAFWARVVGCAYHGHPAYNPAPDRQWHLKNGGGGRPQSDDVAVSMPSRAYWDCIGGAGADGYTFRPGANAEPLPAEQDVYPPPVPEGAAPVPQPTPTPAPTPSPDCRYQPIDLGPIGNHLAVLAVQVTAAREDLDMVVAQVAALRAEVQDVRNALRNGLAVSGTASGGWTGTKTITGEAKG